MSVAARQEMIAACRARRPSFGMERAAGSLRLDRDRALGHWAAWFAAYVLSEDFPR